MRVLKDSAGDMLMMTAGGITTRIHGPFISDEEINIVKSLQNKVTQNMMMIFLRKKKIMII